MEDKARRELTSRQSSITKRTETETSTPSMFNEEYTQTRGEGDPSKQSHTGATTSSSSQEEQLPCWYPKCCGKPVLYGKPEALGWLLGMTGQTVVILGLGTFLVPALVMYAKLEVGCPIEIPEGQDELPECNEKVRGFIRPSSLITTTQSILSLCIAAFTPVAGALVDYTHHRQTIGRVLATVYFCAIFPQLFLSESTWFPLALILLLVALIAVALTLVLHAYLPELTDNEEELNDLTKIFLAGPGVTVIFYILIVIGLSFALGIDGDEGTIARLAILVGLIFLVVCFGCTWGLLMKPRPATNTLQEGEYLATAGFRQIFRTIRKLYRTNVGLLWFFGAVAFGDVKSLTSLALTFLNENQQFTSADVGIAAIIMLLSIIPGAAMSSYFNRKINPVRSSMLSLLLTTATTCVAAGVLTGPGQKLRTFVIVACWGTFAGWKIVSTNMLVAAILPNSGQDTELMGFYLFADTSLSWLPPLIFTSLNEAGLTQRVGLSSISLFFIVSMFMYMKMGSYEDAVKNGKRLVATDSGSNVKDHDNLLIQLELAETGDETKASHIEAAHDEIVSLESILVEDNIIINTHDTNTNTTTNNNNNNNLQPGAEQKQQHDQDHGKVRGMEITRGEWDQKDTVYIHSTNK